MRPIRSRIDAAQQHLPSRGTLRFIGVAEFIVAGNADAFRRNLEESAKLELQLFERSARGEEIDLSLLSILAYKDVFDALAAGDAATAQELGERLREQPHIEKEHDHPFDRCLGFALRAFVCGSSDEMASRLADFTSICREPENIDFTGYANVFRGMLDQVVGHVQEGLSAIVKGHKNLIRRGGVFHGTEDEVVSVWGVAMANLARSQGMRVAGVSPFIPNELLCN